ncbi:MAG TPA: alpha/beta hydrolase [Dehalococcoidia bacterium]|nr:alpha/beta hydrolase [Dehalococcoidia bacterium]
MASKELEMIIEVIRSRPTREGLSVEEQRAAMEATFSQFPVADDVQCQPVDAGGVPAEWVTAPEAVEERVIYYLHGGGYVMGSIGTHREMSSRLSRAARARVLLLDYRLAPENPFPAAVEDSVAGYHWLLSTGVNPALVVVAGESAGGGLTVATLVALRNAGDPLPAAAISVSPWVDMEALGESMTTKAEADPISSREWILTLAKTYLGDVDPRTPLAAPLYADLGGLPPLLIQVGTSEVLLDDAARLAERARAAGVDVILEPWEDMIHMWHFFPMLPEGQQAIDRIGEFVREKIG